MATVNPPPGALAIDHHNGADPFVTGPHDTQRQRYSAYDNSQFSLYLHGSPIQAKRALEAHLAETTRRLQETSHLGNALVQQRKEIEDKLKEVEGQQQESDIGPELRQRLADLEKEFNEVGRETARAFLPKSRAPSGETDAAGGASVYSSEAQHSPTKVSVPSRKQRNQQPSRINDIALATEISTSLLSQLKDLQAVLLEKDEALKEVDLERSQLEIEVEGLSQRLRTLDESESRLKDVNWNLETQVRESEAQFKSAADKEDRLNHALNLARTEKSSLEREFEELKQVHAKLNDDHINKNRQHDAELSGLRRNVTMGETERGAMQRRVEELTTQNQELAKAVAYRMKSEEYAQAEDTSPDDAGEEGDTMTPEHSPPPSPSKATPRHGILESETLRHSLQHAHRMIQQLKNNIHREKTEKIDLKRMLQDARDELEKDRSLNGGGSASKRRKNDKDVFKKPARPDRLGALRAGTHEILLDDEDWEEQEGMPGTPSRRPKSSDPVPGAFPSGFTSAADSSANEGFETANDTSDAAFETANERDGMTTETDAFQTGAETLDGDSSDELTETEGGSNQPTVRHSRSFGNQSSRQISYESTASNSDDDYVDRELRTPIQGQHSRFKMKSRQDSSRKSTPRGGLDFFNNTPPVARDSPASIINHSNGSTPAQGKSLFAELEDLSGDDDDGSYIEGTPSRSSVLSPDSSPDASRHTVLGKDIVEEAVPRPVMVDSGTMTEIDAVKPASISAVWSQHTEPQVPSPQKLLLSSLHAQDTIPQAQPRQDLRLSTLASHETLPKALPPPVLHVSNVSSHVTEPQSVPVPTLVLSPLSAHTTTPQNPTPSLSGLSTLHSQHTAPLEAPAHVMDVSTISAHSTEPRQLQPPQLDVSALTSHTSEPIEPRSTPHSLNVSSISHETTQPKEGVSLGYAAPAALLASALSTQSTEPTVSHDSFLSRDLSGELPSEVAGSTSAGPGAAHQKQQVPLQMSGVAAHTTEPQEVSLEALSSLSATLSQTTEPVSVKRELPQLSGLSAHVTEPIETPRPALSSLSATSSQATEPIARKLTVPRLSEVYSHTTEPTAPQLSPLSISSFSSRSTEPVRVPGAPQSQLSSLTFQDSEPIEPIRATAPALSRLSLQTTQPIDFPRPPRSQLSGTSSLITAPRELPQRALPQVSTISTQHTEPVALAVATPAQHHMSDVHAVQDTQPESPTLPAFLPTPASRPTTANRIRAPVLAFSTVLFRDTEPAMPSRPVTAHRTAPVPLFKDDASSEPASVVHGKQSTATTPGFFDSVLPWTTKENQVDPQETPRSINDGRMPLTPVSANTSAKLPRTPMSDGGTQTMVSAEQIDKLLLARSPRWSGLAAAAAVEKSLSPPGSPGRRNSNDPMRAPRRPGSSGSIRSRAASPPPLPSDHKEVIAAAAKNIPPTTPGAMGPPAMPASAYKKRPQTPSIKTGNTVAISKTSGTTPRPRRHSQRGEARSGASSPLSRRSSLSSFTSEIEQRFNIPGGPSFAAAGLPPGATDPRMIQAITQTMIGEYLWKYTRKTGREDMSENRHRRFFWIHPYTRTLYWSDRDPQSAGKAELKAKSVAIESVQEVDDNNPLPPGLHQKSLLVTTPGRSMKFTATTGQRHETWFNALNYLCQRVEDGDQQKQSQQDRKPAAADEIQDEFNGGYRSSSRMTGRSKASMSSYMSRRASSPHHAQIPTLRQSAVTPQRVSSTEAGQGSVSSRFSNILRPNSVMRGSFSSRRSRTSVQDSITYEEPSNTNMELSRDIHDHVERDLEGMPNVRACCDGKLRPIHLLIKS